MLMVAIIFSPTVYIFFLDVDLPGLDQHPGLDEHVRLDPPNTKEIYQELYLYNY